MSAPKRSPHPPRTRKTTYKINYFPGMSALLLPYGEEEDADFVLLSPQG